MIGRLLFDSKTILADTLNAMEKTSARRGMAEVNLSLLTDGLQAEREQGITIDVAYRYFTTGRRKYIIADAPGHDQYTRNMVTAASTASLAIILVNTRKGILTQTRRHSYLASLVGIPHLLVAVQQMDLVGYRARRCSSASRPNTSPSPPSFASRTCASSPSPHWPATWWSTAASTCPGTRARPCSTSSRTPPPPTPSRPKTPLSGAIHLAPARLGQPRVARLPRFHGAGGVGRNRHRQRHHRTALRCAQPASKKIELGSQSLPRAIHEQSVTLLLEDEIDISRGDLIVKSAEAPVPI